MIGVGGVGMSALAQVLLARGIRVTGSDRFHDRGEDTGIIRALERAGVTLFRQDGSGVRSGLSAVIVSTAIENDNPDIKRAKEIGIPIVHRADALAELMSRGESVAVTGTCGKSTVTAMIGWILEHAGMNPTVVNGAAVIGWESDRSPGNARPGREDLWVVEADESDRSLLSMEPDWAVITNAAADHFSEQEARDLFSAFSARTRKGVVGSLFDSDFFEGFNPSVGPDGSVFTKDGTVFRIHLPGRHNAENAWHAIAMCGRLGVAPGVCAEALCGFSGLRRRLEKVGASRGVAVFDDYAHNPAKIRAAWNAVAEGGRRVIGVWRPHGFKPLRLMMDDLEGSFSDLCRNGGILFVMPVYDAGGTADRNINSDVLVERLLRRGAPARFVATMDEAAMRACDSARDGDVILVMGARDPRLPDLCREILAGLERRFR